MRTPTAMAAIGLCAAAAAAGQTPGFYLVGFPPGGTSSTAYALSSEGGTAVGIGGIPGGPTAGFIWTQAGGRYDFGLEPGMPPVTVPFSVSSNGGVLAGYMRAAPGAERRAFRWAGVAVPQDLGVLPGHVTSIANGISGDGSIVTGQSEVAGGGNTFGLAFRWTEATGMQPLPHLRPGGSLTQAKAISRDGSTIVGLSQTGGISGPIEAFSWTQGGGMVPLPGLPGAPSSAWETANAVSADGSVIVGYADNGLGDKKMARWTAAGLQDLGVAPGYLDSIARAVSDDGFVVAGLSYSGGDSLASVWTPETGHVSLMEYLASSSVVVPAGWTLVEAHAVSGDGLTFAGEARSAAGVRQGFVATIPAPASGFLVFGSVLLLARRRRAAR